MSPAQLLAHFDRICEAPGAVPRLRRFILDLAVRGKLVEQDPSDEPAAELLKLIPGSNVELAGREQKRPQGSTSPSLSRRPFAIPSNWAWTRLGDVGDWGSGSTPPRGNPRLYGGGIVWIKSGELNDNPELATSGETITQAALNAGSFRRNQPGDVLIAMYGATIGKVAILSQPAVTNQAVCGCTPFVGLSSRFLFEFLKSQRTQFHLASEGGAQPNISKMKLVRFPLPLPPLPEQEPIVRTVDELMALCERLEAVQAERERRRDRLVVASLSRLNEARPAPATGTTASVSICGTCRVRVLASNTSRSCAGQF